jgi:hypothetical protein
MVIWESKASTLSCFLAQEHSMTMKINTIENLLCIFLFITKLAKPSKLLFVQVGSLTSSPTEAADWRASNFHIKFCGF